MNTINDLNTQTDEYFNELIQDRDQHARLWEAVVMRAIYDWRCLLKSYDILQHRELYRFFFFKSKYLTAETICLDYLDNAGLLKRTRRAVMRIGQSGATDLLRLDVSSTDDCLCSCCKRVVPFYDSWSYLESAKIWYSSKKIRSANRWMYCFNCKPPAYVNSNQYGHWQHGAKRKTMLKDLEANCITITPENMRVICKQP